MHEDPAAVITVTAEERTAVEAVLRRRDLPLRLRERLEMVKAAALGQDVAAIARWSGRTPETVRRWLAAFRGGGIAALADAPRPGATAESRCAYLAALEQAVETPPRTLGLPFDVWTSARLSAYLAQQTGIRIAPGWLRVLLHRQRFACGRPQTHPRLICKTRPKWPPARTPCGWRGKKVAAAPERYELHYEDETHLETNPSLGRVWHRVGAAANAAGGGHQPPPDRLRQRRGAGPGAGRGAPGATGLGRLRPLSGGAGGAARGDRTADHPGAGQRSLPRQQGHAGGAGRARGVAGGDPPGSLQPPPQPQGARVAHPQARPSRPSGPDLRAFVDAVAAGLAGLGGERCEVIDAVPQWWLDGHRKEPTGRRPGRPHGAKDARPRKPRGKNLPADT